MITTITPCWSQGYEAGKAGIDAGAGWMQRCTDYREGYSAGRIVASRLSEVAGLLILPSENAADLVADMDAAIDEKERKPGYTAEPSSDLEWQFGWSVFYSGWPVGIYIRTNMAMDGWKTAREDALAVDVDREVYR